MYGPRAGQPAWAAGRKTVSPERDVSYTIRTGWVEAIDRLAVHLGPVAKLFVTRAAKQASNTRDFYERLAAHIDDPQSPRRFAAGIEELSEP